MKFPRTLYKSESETIRATDQNDIEDKLASGWLLHPLKEVHEKLFDKFYPKSTPIAEIKTVDVKENKTKKKIFKKKSK